MSVATHSIAGEHRFWKKVFISTTHCVSGCVIGDVIGAPIVFAAGWMLFVERLYADYVILFALAYVFGIAFQYFPIRAMRKVRPAWRS
jgi:ABC-type nitrate/sulfonate/bicarbonate transport system permease component